MDFPRALQNALRVLLESTCDALQQDGLVQAAQIICPPALDATLA